MQCFMIVILYLLFVHGSEGITPHSVTGCSDSVSDSVNISCNYTEMIHVERITYYNGTDCNQTVTDLQVSCQPLTGSDTGLVPSCNGKVSCNQFIYYSYCPNSKAAKIDYKCIPGNDVKDMCDAFILDSTNRIFLSTPNYPLSPTFTDISPCRCSIRGSNITSIQILELILQTSVNGTKSSLEIKYGDVTHKTESYSDTSIRRVYNKRLSTASTTSPTAEIIVNHNNINGLFIWIEVQGVSMRVSCNNETNKKDVTTSSSSPRLTSPTPSLASSSSSPTFTITTPSPTKPSTQSSFSTMPTSAKSPKSVSGELNIEPSSSTDSSSSTTTAHPPQTADIKSHSQDKDIVIILAVLWPLSIILIMCITAIIIIVLLRRKKLVWVKTSPQVERERSQYSGLDLNQRVAGNDGTYQDLSTRNLRSTEEEGERNPYSGLDQAQRVSGNDGTYQELNTRNSTSQYNNVSQNTHNDYYNLN